jgi:urease accessory protein
MKTTNIRHCAIALALALLATTSHAHPEAEAAAGFVPGLLHPFTGLDHLLAMLAVGMWAAVLGGRMVSALPLAFPLFMAAGAAAAMAGWNVPMAEPAVAASVLVLGLAMATAWRSSSLPALALVAIFGFAHGHAHGMELPAHASAAAYAGGFLLSTAILHLLGIGLGQLRAVPRGAALLRTAGLAIGLAGIWLLAGGPALA